MRFEEIDKTYDKVLSTQRMFSSIPLKLTDKEKLAIGLRAGVKTRLTINSEGSLHCMTEPFGVGWTGDEFIVLTKGEN